MGPAAQKFMLNFQEEIASLKDQRYKDFIIRVVDGVCPAYFWEREASKGGHHPQFTNGVGGLVRHVKYACQWMEWLLRALDTENGKDGDPSPLHDICITALLLHDCMKDGDPAKDHLGRSYKAISGCHGVDMAEAIFTRVLQGRIEWREQKFILFAIAAHMGVWTGPEPLRKYRPFNLKGSKARKIATLVHIADYCASRKVDAVIPKLTAFTVQ